MASYTPKLKEILRPHGCCFERSGKGDHDIWFSPITQRRFPVDQKILSRQTANAVLRQAGIEKQF
jgi:HicA toxin of bacterial toxin-antitoxin,